MGCSPDLMLRNAAFTFCYALVGLSSAPAVAADRLEAEKALVEAVNISRSGNPAAARIVVMNAVKADPNWPLPHAVKASMMLTAGDGYGAETEVQRAMQLGMKPDQLNHLLAHALFLKGNTKAALQLAHPQNIATKFQGYAARIRAKAAAKLGDFEAAGKDYDLAVQLNPRSAAIWSDFGKYLSEMGNAAGAIDATVRAVRLDPKRVDSLRLMGILTRDQFGLTAAIPWFRQALSLEPGNLDLMRELAATLGDAGQSLEMLAVTRAMLEADPANAYAFYFQAVLAARAKKYDLARSLLYRTQDKLDAVPGAVMLTAGLDLQLGNPELAIAQLEDLVAQQPANIPAQKLLAAALAAAGDPVSAANTVRRSANRNDADSYTLTMIGRAEEENGNLSAAMAYLDRASEPASGDSGPFDMAGDLLRHAKANAGPSDNADIAVPYINRLLLNNQGEEALTAAERLRARNQGAPAAHVLAGDVLMSLNRPAEAATAYRDAANIRFSEPIMLRLFDALIRSGDRVAALRVLDLYLTQNPMSIAALILAADHFSGTQQWDKATGILSDLNRRLEGRDAAVMSNLGWALYNKGERERAIKNVSAAYTVMPMNAAFADNYGWVLFKSNANKKHGLALLSKAVALAPGHPGLRYHLGQALVSVGRTAEAKAHLQAAANTDGFRDAQAAAHMLSRL